ncbi:2-amino-4-hydroxy-6-hydroxymethyldihydropteridine diphosphokinase [Quisquiliibacterium transsilvanicum]|uniref:2-amino-4-hydroxy-6-hydroxymethyldihydropteridine pyrophosphokinase n=1 Tax=Quisquiliibacterium transsilvanicum TaxID=1549638 RepID=A0A7W8HHQ6_9BURK|nr:2-amino-4-hydroxy-6-hydroxymethyldihydropteridine diphosphokinase [Quisquiliibacterium transsilvanicum]MBB5271455.1 2-amino-4-hydroxy-6-hydroxymethyldihydropteridine diphosphokinase [Quisquiliibacterium transsilvanicum]
MDATSAWIGLGANLGDARRAIVEALAGIARLEGTRLAGVSSLYRSAPVDAEGPDFLNAVARVDTTLPPEALLDALQAIEQAHGRQRSHRNAPRTLDLDLLAWGDTISAGPRLILPHPRMHTRAFVLVPLSELAPRLRLPGLPPLATLLAGCSDQRLVRALPAETLLELVSQAAAPSR